LGKKRVKDIERAKQLRSQGWSLSEIADDISADTSQVSKWVRDVKLSEEAQKILDTKNPASKDYAKDRYSEKRGSAISETWRERRRQYQQEGGDKAKENNSIHRGACMLYWAEGTKDRQNLAFTNSDVNMIIVFKKFLEDYFNVNDDNFTVTLNFYDDIHNQTEIEQYWLKALGLRKKCLRKPQINALSKYSKQKKCGKNEWGTCKLRLYGVSSVLIIQHIYGAIKEYAGIDNDKWLD